VVNVKNKLDENPNNVTNNKLNCGLIVVVKTIERVEKYSGDFIFL
jgi:hypothetical protein